jgi:hypothetical protein
LRVASSSSGDGASNDLLVAALDRAFAFAEIDDVAVLVAEHLDFDVARIDDELLDEDAVVAEGRLRLGLRALEPVRNFILRMGDAHALAAAAGGGLDHDRIADLAGNLDRVLRVFDHPEEARHRRNFSGGRRFLRFDLVAHRLDGADVRADERDLCFLERFGKGRTLGKKAVARMHRFRAHLLAGVDDLVDQKIGLGGGRRTDVDGLVRHLDMQRVLVGVGIDRDRRNAHALRGLDDTAGDLAAVGDQYLLEHARPGLRQNPILVCGAI